YFAASDPRGICPTGWHLPSQAEWNTLAQFAGDTLHSGLKLKAAVNWSGSIGGVDALGMGVLPAGVGYNDHVFSFLGSQANFWACDTQFTDVLGGNYRQIGFDRTPNQTSFTRLELHALSVRCIKDASISSVNAVLPYLITLPFAGINQNSATGGGRILSDGGSPITSKGVCWSTTRNPSLVHPNATAGGSSFTYSVSLTGLNPGTWYYVRAFATNSAGTAYGPERMFHTLPASTAFTCGTDSIQDRSGFKYATVSLGTQCWTKSHLRARVFTNGDSIPWITDSLQWKNTTLGAWSAYQNNLQYELVYGKLYNWYAIADSRKLCPLGWHVPSNAELTTLINHTVGRGYPNTSSNVNGAGSALKSCRQLSSPLGGTCNTSIHPYWNSHTTHRGTDALGLSILPAGARSGDDGQFTSLTGYCLLLSSTLSSTNLVQGQYFRNSTGNISPATGTKRWGGSVRCVKD
ncbi:MAG: FISUMP domain-containing protein, partial [Bacteroidota bacterium]